jgi:hypothetical protein
MSTASPDPYDVLGVAAGASAEQLKAAYRAALRQAHPDTGGSTERFIQVQAAWKVLEPATELPSGSSRVPTTHASTSWMPRSSQPSSRSSAGAKSFGHPGGWFRELYGQQVRAWVGRGSAPGNIFDQELVSRLPGEIRHTLHAAMAEENTAVELATLGSGFVSWHDVLISGNRSTQVRKIDHIVLGPSLLWAIQSEDWGTPVEINRGEMVGEGIARGEKPVRELWSMTKQCQRSLGVRFSALMFVVPNEHAREDSQLMGEKGGVPAYLVRTSAVTQVLSMDQSLGSHSIVGDDLYPLRQKLDAGIRFV